MNTPCCPTPTPGVTTNPENRLPSVEPVADIRRTPTGYTLEMDLPGVTPADLTVEVDRGLLTVSGTARVEFDADKPGRYAEFGARVFRRAFRLGEGLDAAAIQAHHRHGVLRLEIPLRPAVQPRKIAVQAEG
jgi:HSP20 family molecular chaperone IbpA